MTDIHWPTLWVGFFTSLGIFAAGYLSARTDYRWRLKKIAQRGDAITLSDGKDYRIVSQKEYDCCYEYLWVYIESAKAQKEAVAANVANRRFTVFADDGIVVMVGDLPMNGTGGSYDVVTIDGRDQTITHLEFTNRDKRHGLTDEALLHLLKHHLSSLQQCQDPKTENDLAVFHIDQAILALQGGSYSPHATQTEELKQAPVPTDQKKWEPIPVEEFVAYEKRNGRLK